MPLKVPKPAVPLKKTNKTVKVVNTLTKKSHFFNLLHVPFDLRLLSYKIYIFISIKLVIDEMSRSTRQLHKITYNFYLLHSQPKFFTYIVVFITWL